MLEISHSRKSRDCTEAACPMRQLCQQGPEGADCVLWALRDCQKRTDVLLRELPSKTNGFGTLQEQLNQISRLRASLPVLT